MRRVSVLGPPRVDDPRAASTHLSYTFGQVEIDKPEIDYLSLCGNLIAAIQKRFQNGLSEILLPDDRDSHGIYFAFGGAENAPACFFAAISSSLKPRTSLRISSVCSPSVGER